MELSELAQLLVEYDKENWVHQPGFDTVEHSYSHLGKLMGKLAAYVEEGQHPGEEPSRASRELLIREIIPDLLMFALRLVNNENSEAYDDLPELELEDLFEMRIEDIKKRFLAL